MPDKLRSETETGEPLREKSGDPGTARPRALGHGALGAATFLQLFIPGSKRPATRLPKTGKDSKCLTCKPPSTPAIHTVSCDLGRFWGAGERTKDGTPAQVASGHGFWALNLRTVGPLLAPSGSPACWCWSSRGTPGTRPAGPQCGVVCGALCQPRDSTGREPRDCPAFTGLVSHPGSRTPEPSAPPAPAPEPTLHAAEAQTDSLCEPRACSPEWRAAIGATHSDSLQVAGSAAHMLVQRGAGQGRGRTQSRLDSSGRRTGTGIGRWPSFLGNIPPVPGLGHSQRSGCHAHLILARSGLHADPTLHRKPPPLSRIPTRGHWEAAGLRPPRVNRQTEGALSSPTLTLPRVTRWYSGGNNLSKINRESTFWVGPQTGTSVSVFEGDTLHGPPPSCLRPWEDTAPAQGRASLESTSNRGHLPAMGTARHRAPESASGCGRERFPRPPARSWCGQRGQPVGPENWEDLRSPPAVPVGAIQPAVGAQTWEVWKMWLRNRTRQAENSHEETQNQQPARPSPYP